MGDNFLLCGFPFSFVSSFVNKSKFNVRFNFNRLPLKLQYRACELAEEEGLECLLFPTPSNICTRTAYPIPNDRRYVTIVERGSNLKNCSTWIFYSLITFAIVSKVKIH